MVSARYEDKQILATVRFIPLTSVRVMLYSFPPPDVSQRRVAGVTDKVAVKAEPLEVVSHFQALAKTLSNRYPTSVKTAVCLSNYAAGAHKMTSWMHDAVYFLTPWHPHVRSS